jgi:ACT domain-containing protein
MKAVITVMGRDTVGIIAATSAVLARCNVNILDITQSVMGDIFVMVMFTDISKCSVPFAQLQSDMNEVGRGLGMQILTVHEDIFNAMHTI